MTQEMRIAEVTASDQIVNRGSQEGSSVNTSIAPDTMAQKLKVSPADNGREITFDQVIAARFRELYPSYKAAWARLAAIGR